jgi:hypothetical protein
MSVAPKRGRNRTREVIEELTARAGTQASAEKSRTDDLTRPTKPSTRPDPSTLEDWRAGTCHGATG